MRTLQDILRHRQIIVLMICMCLGLPGCKDEVTTPTTTVDPIRAISAVKIENPAIWNESVYKTRVERIVTANQEDFYNFLVSTGGPRQARIVGQSEKESIRRDHTKTINSDFLVTDLYAFRTSFLGPTLLTAGGIDLDNKYSSLDNLDKIALPFPFAYTPVSNAISRKSYFSSITRADTRGDVFSEEKIFYIAGNSYDDTGIVRPFLSTMEGKWSFSNSGKITTISYFDDLARMEFIKIHYDITRGLYILAFDTSTSEIVLMLYKDVDVKNNYKHEIEDSYQQIWSMRFKSLTVDKALANMALHGERIYVAGTTSTEKGDLAGKLIALDAVKGTLLQETSFNYSDEDDGFFGVVRSGDNIFVYGFSNRAAKANEVIASKGWTIKLSSDGKAMKNYFYEEDNANIEFTTAVAGYGQNDFDGYGNLAIGGSRRTDTGYVAFATQFKHYYKN